MDAQVGLVRALVPVTLTLHVHVPAAHPSVLRPLKMVAVGEKSGELARMLEKVSRALENEAESDLRSLVALLEPLLILAMGVAVGFIALSILLPLLEMSQMIR